MLHAEHCVSELINAHVLMMWRNHLFVNELTRAEHDRSRVNRCLFTMAPGAMGQAVLPVVLWVRTVLCIVWSEES